MTTIYLCRHGQCDGNRYRQFDGQYNSPLTGLGRRQAAALARRFADEDIAAVYSSDLIRSYDTANAIAMSKGLVVQTRRDLRESNIGLWDHMLWADIDEKWHEQIDWYDHHMEKWTVPGAELPASTGMRYYNALWEIARKHDGQSVVVVGHGDANRLAIGYLKHIPIEKIGEDNSYSTPSAVCKLEFENDTVRFVYEHDYSHLDDSTMQKTSPYWGMGFQYRYLVPGNDFPIEGLTDTLNFAEGVWVGAYRDGKPAAIMQMLPTEPQNPGEIGYYFVAPEFRGKRVGIITLGQAVEVYRNAAVKSLRIHVPKELEGFFEKFDFVHVCDDTWELAILPAPPLDR